MRIVHLSDIHIRTLKYHSQYRTVFENFYKSLNGKNPDLIFFAGDLFHNKTASLTPESVSLAVEFLNKLSDIAPVKLILGNHDYSQRNLSRIDAVSPIEMALSNKNIRLYKYSQEVDVGNDIVLNILSIYDKKWEVPKNKNKINVCCYHGMFRGIVTQTGWVCDKADLELEFLNNYDYGFFGDLHYSNYCIDKNGHMRYAGSFLQQNFSEELVKGYLLWDIKNKEEFVCEFIPVFNPNPYITINLLNDGTLLDDIDISSGSRVRLLSNFNLSYETIQKTLSFVKNNFHPETVIYVPPKNKLTVSVNTIDEVEDNLRNIDVQERLIKEYLNEFNVSEQLLNNVYELNKKYNTLIEQKNEEVRGIEWKLKSLEWSNLFNYGENNVINFDNLSGIVGLFGKSYSGKTNAISCLEYIIFNSISKNSRKNYNIINQNKDIGGGKAIIEVGNDLYVIERISEKYDKKLKGNITEEAKTNVEFCIIKNGVEESLNGIERTDTDNNIRKIFGTIDDFLLTSVSSQFGSLSFINEGSTKRKEILTKFLDLEMFDEKYKLAKEEVTVIKSALKKIETVDYEKVIKNIKKELVSEQQKLEKEKKHLNLYKNVSFDLSKKIIEIDTKLHNFQIVDVVNINNILNNLKNEHKEYDQALEDKNKIKQEIDEINNTILKIEDFLNNIFDIEEQRNKKSEVEIKTKENEKIEKNIQLCEYDIKIHKKQSDLIEQVPCGEENKHCKFIKGAYEAREIVEQQKKILLTLQNNKQKLLVEISQLEPTKIEELIQKYDKLVEKKQQLFVKLTHLQLEYQKKIADIVKIQEKINQFEKTKKDYYKNQETIEQIKTLKRDKEKIEKEKELTDKQIDFCEATLLEITKKCGSYEQQLKDINNTKQEIEKLREEYSAFELYLQCTHYDGLPSIIIKRKLPTINNEISKLLANVVDFNVFLEINGNKLDILIKHPSFQKRPLEMASGAEKTIAALAIRLVLIKICGLNKGNFLILDEVATGFDETILDGFIKLLNVVKEQFQFILLITHLEQLKDVADTEIVINQDNYKYAHIEQ